MVQSSQDSKTIALVAAVRQQPERFVELYEHVAPALWAWCQLRVQPGLRATLDPADLMQEAWLRAMRSFATFDATRGSFRAWLIGIARNALLEGLRGLRRFPQAVDMGPSTRIMRLENCPDSVSAVSQRLARDEFLQAFLERVEELSNDDRRILVRCGLEERTCAETAERMGLTEAAVQKRWQRLRRELRDRGWAQRLLLAAP